MTNQERDCRRKEKLNILVPVVVLFVFCFLNKGALGPANYVAGQGSTLAQDVIWAQSQLSCQQQGADAPFLKESSRGPDVLRAPLNFSGYSKGPYLPRYPESILRRGRVRHRAQDSEFSKRLWKPATRGSSTPNRLTTQTKGRTFHMESRV